MNTSWFNFIKFIIIYIRHTLNHFSLNRTSLAIISVLYKNIKFQYIDLQTAHNPFSLQLPKYGKTKSNNYYNACFGKKGNWLTRLRLGLSALNNHRFKYHLISNPFCTHCGNIPETIEHYFFECPRYAAPRLSFLNTLADIGVNINDKISTLNEILHGTSFIRNPEIILNPIFIFLTTSNRFK